MIEPHAPLADATLYALKVEGVTDRAGNAVVTKTAGFTTSSEPDLTRPRVVRVSPSGQSEPVNSVVVVEFDEAMDPASINGETLGLFDQVTGLGIAGTVSVESSNRRAFFAPSANLLVSRQYRVTVSSAMEDTAGNLLLGTSAVFTTRNSADNTPPAVARTDPAGGDAGVPTNAQVTVETSEAIDPISVGGTTVELKRGGTPLGGAFSFQDGNRRIVFTPGVPLLASSGHTLAIQGLRDTAGKVQAVPLALNFTTGPGADLVSPTIVTQSPVNGATGVPAGSSITVEFSERVVPSTVNSASAVLRINATSVIVDGSLGLDAARKVLTFTPAAPLQASTLYRFTLTNAISDTAGNSLSATTFTFTTGP